MIDWVIDSDIEENTIYIYDKTKLVRKIYDDYEIIEFDGKPIMKRERGLRLAPSTRTVENG